MSCAYRKKSLQSLVNNTWLAHTILRYFTKVDQQGVCIFRRRKTTEYGHRGFRLSSLGIFLPKSRRPVLGDMSRRWRSLLIEFAARGYWGVRTARRWLGVCSHIFRRKDVEAGRPRRRRWLGWLEWEVGRRKSFPIFYCPNFSFVCHSKAFAEPIDFNPTLHPHLLRILGPSSSTLYKHILGRKRILIYKLPPVEVACILGQTVKLSLTIMTFQTADLREDMETPSICLGWLFLQMWTVYS